MANTFGFAVLFLWPFLAGLAFCRLPVAMGISAAVIGGYLFLPPSTSVDFPMLPAFGKDLSAVLAAFLVVLFHNAFNPQPLSNRLQPLGSSRPGWLPTSPSTVSLILILLFSPFLSAASNRAPLVFERNWLPGMSLYDAFSVALSLSMMILPFILARRYMASPAGQKALLTVLAVLAGIYMLPTLFEVRMSPQLNTWIYGFFPHSFAQHMRGDGFRPVVFLSHGLWLSMFLAMGFLASIACARLHAGPTRTIFSIISFGLFVTLVLTKSLGALLIALVFAPFVIFADRAVQLAFAASMIGLVLLYPALRTTALFPETALTSVAAVVSEQRAASLGTRLYHERQVMEKAMEKPLSGWGSWGRWRVYDEAGRDMTISDGKWVITLGEGGLLRFLGLFGLLSAPILISSFSRVSHKLGIEHSSLALVLSANMIDLIPNAGLTVITWLLAGSLVGRLELEKAGHETSDISEPETTLQARGGRAYTRFHGISRNARVPQTMDRAQDVSNQSRKIQTESVPSGERYSRFAASHGVRASESSRKTAGDALSRGRRQRLVSELSDRGRF